MLRGHIGSFADQVYPIYALARFGQAYGVQPAVEMAGRCGEAICRMQGPSGQWWWHYDTRTGKVFETYPSIRYTNTVWRPWLCSRWVRRLELTSALRFTKDCGGSRKPTNWAWT